MTYELFNGSKMINYYDLFKVGKMTILIMTCSKLAVLHKAIQGTFFKPQKSKIDSKDTNSYLLEKSSDK